MNLDDARITIFSFEMIRYWNGRRRGCGDSRDTWYSCSLLWWVITVIIKSDRGNIVSMFWISWSSSSLSVLEYVNLTLNPNSTKRLPTVRTLIPSKVAISTTVKLLPIRKSSWSLGIEFLGRPRCPQKAVASDETSKIFWLPIRQSRAPPIRLTQFVHRFHTNEQDELLNHAANPA